MIIAMIPMEITTMMIIDTVSNTTSSMIMHAENILSSM